MILILEGADGVGKSTLAKKLSEMTGIPVIKPPGSPLLNGMPSIVSQAEDRGALCVAVAVAENVDMIFDRWFPSEHVYAKVFAREDYVEEMTLEADRLVATLPHMCVLLYQDPTKITWQWLRNRGVDDIAPSAWKRVAEGYDEYVTRSNMTWVLIGAQTPTDLIVDQLQRHLKIDTRERDDG